MLVSLKPNGLLEAFFFKTITTPESRQRGSIVANQYSIVNYNTPGICGNKFTCACVYLPSGIRTLKDAEGEPVGFFSDDCIE